MSTRHGKLGWLASTTAAVVALTAAGAPAHPPAPRSSSQPGRDGCQRSDFGIGFNQTPQWVYVYRSRRIRKAQGVTRVSHASLDDSIGQHDWYDFNGNLVLKRRYRYLLGGNPRQHTGNFSGHDEETRRLHFEWEERTWPRFAWPTDGDRTTIWGSWIWDCGHWTTSAVNVGGKVEGEHTELHPLNAIVVYRRSPYRRKRVASQADVFISNQGTKAHAVEDCALSHHPMQGGPYPRYDSGFRPCAMSPANRIQPVKRRYRFFVPAPRRPGGASRLRFRAIKRIRPGSGHQRIRVERNGIAVAVSLKRVRRPVRYGRSFVVWWSGPATRRPTPLKIKLKSLFIRHSDPEPIYRATRSPWNLYLNLNGYWKRLNEWLPQLRAVHDGQRIAVNHTVKIYVPRGHRLWLQLGGRECDEPGGTTVFGTFANVVHPCPANKTEINPNPFKLLSNDDTGTILDVYRSARAALGRHVSTSLAEPRWPGTGRTGLRQGPKGQGNRAFDLTYVVRRARR